MLDLRDGIRQSMATSKTAKIRGRCQKATISRRADVEKLDVCFVVTDSVWQTLAYVYVEDDEP